MALTRSLALESIRTCTSWNEVANDGHLALLSLLSNTCHTSTPAIITSSKSSVARRTLSAPNTSSRKFNSLKESYWCVLAWAGRACVLTRRANGVREGACNGRRRGRLGAALEGVIRRNSALLRLSCLDSQRPAPGGEL